MVWRFLSVSFYLFQDVEPYTFSRVEIVLNVIIETGFFHGNSHATELAPLDYIPRELLSYFRVCIYKYLQPHLSYYLNINNSIVTITFMLLCVIFVSLTILMRMNILGLCQDSVVQQEQNPTLEKRFTRCFLWVVHPAS